MRPAISFCTWILDRCHQYSQVLPVNLMRTLAYDVEFVLLDVGSTDGLCEHLQTVADDRLRVIREPWSADQRHFARLYNRAAAHATGQILVTLDADNAIGPDFCDAALRWATPNSFLWASNGDWSGGTIGRVAFERGAFWRLGGYDESLGPVGYQDVDLMNRAKAVGMRRRFMQRPSVVGHAIRNTKAETAACLCMTAAEYQKINSENAAKSRDNVAAGRLVANQRT